MWGRHGDQRRPSSEIAGGYFFEIRVSDVIYPPAFSFTEISPLFTASIPPLHDVKISKHQLIEQLVSP